MRSHFCRKINARRAFTMIELLVVIVLVSILLALLLPAVYAVRAAARRAQCQTNLRSIGHGLLAFESSTGRLPAGRDQTNWADHSWATRILPNLDEQGLYDQYDWRKSWWDMGDGQTWPSPWEVEYVNGQRDDVAGNLAVAATDVSVFVCPETPHKFKGAMDYGGNYGSTMTGLEPGFAPGQAWESGLLVATNLGYVDASRRRGVRISEVRDGQSNTFLVLEDSGRIPHEGGMWANGHNCFAVDSKMINRDPSNEVRSDHSHLAYALLGDGSVMALTDDMDIQVIGAMSTRDHAEAYHSIQ